MTDTILQLYPLPCTERPLKGVYLAHDLRACAAQQLKPFVYANFVTSLDGRIAVPRPSGKGMMVPRNTSNARDWRLYQELSAQADLILSSGRYLRDWASGQAQEILQVDDPRFADLREWRASRGLKPMPDLAIISSSLNFELPEVLTAGGRRAIFFTTANPSLNRVRELERRAGEVLVAGENRVDGKALVEQIQTLGYRTVYSAAGPKVLHLLAAGGVLDRLYLTFANRLLAAEKFSTIADGPLLDPAAAFRTHSIYFDPQGLDGLGQLFAAYDRA